MSGYQGFQEPNTAGSELNAISFVVKQLIGRIGTATIVQIKAVTNAGGVQPVGFVDVVPLVNQVDGAGNAMPHGTIHGLPYSRLQGGANAVILDPQIGDIGIAVFASRDISSVKANKGQANPGSWRRNDMADGMYVGGLLNGTPTQYVQFSTLGITLVSPTRVLIQAPVIDLEGALTNNGHAVGSTHVHSGVQSGSGTSGVPT